MLEGVWLRSAFAVAASETVPPVLLAVRSTPIHVPDTPADVGLTDTVPAWLAGDCATNAAAIVRVHAPTRLRLVTSKISIAQGVPVTLGVAFATNRVVVPDASTELSALNVTVESTGWRRTGAPPAVIGRAASVLQAPGASSGLSPSAGQASRPAGTAEMPA